MNTTKTPFVRAYLRASTEDQDAERARGDLEAFAAEHGLAIASTYVENESGAKLQRPELFRLIADARKGDILLVEQVDRLTRLTGADWDELKAKLAHKSIRVVSLDLPTSWLALQPARDEMTQGILDAVGKMMMDVLAVVARKDYDDRRRRQAQGIEKARTSGLYKGRQVDAKRHAVIAEMLDKGMSWSAVCQATGASRSTLLRVVNARKDSAKAAA